MTALKTAPVQAAFDSRILSIQQPLSGSAGPGLPNTVIQRGYIRQNQPFPGYANGTSGQHVFHFLYNPSTVQAMYSVQTTGAALTYLYANPSDVADLSAPINASVAFTVMFDRTYELWQSYGTDGVSINANSAQQQQYGNDATVVGVVADIMQLMLLTGMGEQGSVGLEGLNQLGGSDTLPNQGSFNSASGFMMMVPCWTYFGPANGVLSYYGYISEWDYTITHWSQYMVPMRAAIDINLQLLPPPVPVSNVSNPGFTAAQVTTGGGGVPLLTIPGT